MTRPTTSSVVTVVLLGAAAVSIAAQQQPQQDTQVFRFKTGVELINVTATVTDRNGRFVSGLEKQDFRLFDDGLEQQITHFNAERVPVSLGLVVDTSGSMEGEKSRCVLGFIASCRLSTIRRSVRIARQQARMVED